MKKFDYLAPQPEVGRSARDLRVRCNLTQEEFASMIGVTRQTIINFETGKRQSMEILQQYLKLAKGLL